MPAKAIVLVRDLIPGDEDLMFDLDVNVLDDGLRAAIDADIDLDIVLPKDIPSGAIYDYVTQAVADELIDRSGEMVTRYEIMLPGWNALRQSAVENLFIFDDFISDRTGDGQIGELGWRRTLSGSASVTTVSTSSLYEMPGQIRVQSGTTNGSTGQIYHEELSWDTIGEVTFTWRYTAATSRASHYLRIGLANSTGTHGLYVEINSGSWRFVSMESASTLGTSSTGLNTSAVAMTLRITNLGEQAYLVLETDLGGRASALLPAPDQMMQPRFRVTSGATNNATLDVDYFSLRGSADRG